MICIVTSIIFHGRLLYVGQYYFWDLGYQLYNHEVSRRMGNLAVAWMRVKFYSCIEVPTD